MKKIFLLLIVVPLLSLTSTNTQDRFVGKWLGDDGSEIGYIEFDKEGYASIGMGDQIMGGKEFTLRGEKGSMTYQIDTNKQPIEIDLIVTKLESGEQKKLLCIAQFRNDDKMKFAISYSDQRPLEFTEENSVVLKREE